MGNQTSQEKKKLLPSPSPVPDPAPQKTLSVSGNYTPTLYFIPNDTETPSQEFRTGPVVSSWKVSDKTVISTSFTMNYKGSGKFQEVLILVSLPPSEDKTFPVTPYHSGDTDGSFPAPGMINIFQGNTLLSLSMNPSNGVFYNGKYYLGYTIKFDPIKYQGLNFNVKAVSSY